MAAYFLPLVVVRVHVNYPRQCPEELFRFRSRGGEEHTKCTQCVERSKRRFKPFNATRTTDEDASYSRVQIFHATRARTLYHGVHGVGSTEPDSLSCVGLLPALAQYLHEHEEDKRDILSRKNTASSKITSGTLQACWVCAWRLKKVDRWCHNNEIYGWDAASPRFLRTGRWPGRQ